MSPMDRRRFIEAGVAGSVALAAGSLVPTQAAASRPDGPKSVPAFDLDEATIADLQKQMETGAETARSLARKYLDRIGEIDRRGPALRAIIETNPDAEQAAAALDVERRSRGPRGALHGIPVLIKANIDTADRMATTAGSLALAGSIAASDSAVARRLREAGAVILGKTNLSEWANFRSTHSTSGWSGCGGQTRNPYALDRNPSGSSSGTAAAVSASLAAVGVGTETDGSIVSPANNCGLVGVKPTVGLVGRSGIVPIAHSQDTAGPMARTVTDAAILLNALCGADPGDPATAAAAARAARDYTRFLDKAALSGARIGVPRKACFGMSPAADRIVEQAIETMRRLGAVVIDPVDLPAQSAIAEPEFTVLLYEFKADLNAYLGRLGPNAAVHSMKDVIEFNRRHEDREMRWFGQEIMLQAEPLGPLTEPKYRAALAACRRLSRAAGIDAAVTRHRLDALVAPTSGPASLTDLVNGDYGPNGCSTFAAVAGYPHVTVPAGEVFGLPVGLSLFGPAFTEGKLLGLAFAFEQATRRRRPPRFLPTVGLPGDDGTSAAAGA
jgi:amidase